MKPIAMEPAVELTTTPKSSSCHMKEEECVRGEQAEIELPANSNTDDGEFAADDSCKTTEVERQARISPAKNVLYRFFYPKRRKKADFYDPKLHQTPTTIQDETFVNDFWTTFDDILMLSIFTQVGILARLAASTWFARFNDVFSHESALFVNLPLNCASCLCMGMLCSGNQLMEIVTTRLSSTDTVDESTVREEPLEDGDELVEAKRSGLRRRRRRSKYDNTGDIHQELRHVQLHALERRIRASKSLLLFPVSQKDVDVMVHYEHRMNNNLMFDNDLALSSNLQEEDDAEIIEDRQFRSIRHNDTKRTQPSIRHKYEEVEDGADLEQPVDPLRRADDNGKSAHTNARSDFSKEPGSDEAVEQNEEPEQPDFITEFTVNVQENVVENIETFRRVNRNNLLLSGWVKGTTPEEMSDDLLLGLRDGFCGAISSFSSWNSSMVNLLKNGQITEALVGYMLGIQLPIIAYRFGQHIALYVFVWRTRRETQYAERRGGYAIRVSIDEESDHTKRKPKEIPSLRSVFFALFVLALSAQITSVYLVRDPDDQQLALSLLFSPLGVFARWRLRRLNNWRNGLPLGTFVANLLACALAGSLGTVLAGNPGPRERIVLVSVIAGFGGTLSSLATFIVEILDGVDPILLRFDGPIYAALSVGGAMVIAFASSSSVEWVDQTVAAKAGAAAMEAVANHDESTFDNSTFPNATGDFLLF